MNFELLNDPFNWGALIELPLDFGGSDHQTLSDELWEVPTIGSNLNDKKNQISNIKKISK